MLQYKVGEIANFFGISSDMVRYYDNKRIIVAKRGSNGYRYYSREDLITIGYIMALKKLNIPLKEIASFLNESSLEKSIEMVGLHEKQVSREIKELKRIKGNLRDYRKSLLTVKNFYKKVVEINRPVIIYKNISSDNMLDVWADFDVLSNTHTKLFTFVIKEDIFNSECFQDINYVKESFEYALSMKDDDRLSDVFDVKKRGFFLFSPKRCLYSVIDLYAGKDYDNLVNLKNYMMKKGYQVDGDILLRVLSLKNTPEKNRDYYEILIPIK